MIWQIQGGATLAREFFYQELSISFIGAGNKPAGTYKQISKY